MPEPPGIPTANQVDVHHITEQAKPLDTLKIEITENSKQEPVVSVKAYATLEQADELLEQIIDIRRRVKAELRKEEYGE